MKRKLAVDIDDMLLSSLEEVAHFRKISVDELVESAIRESLGLTSASSSLEEPPAGYGNAVAYRELNGAQKEFLEILSFVRTPESLTELNKVVSDYFAKKADAEMEKLWDSGALNSERIEGFRHLHERTPYNR